MATVMTNLKISQDKVQPAMARVCMNPMIFAVRQVSVMQQIAEL